MWRVHEPFLTHSQTDTTLRSFDGHTAEDIAATRVARATARSCALELRGLLLERYVALLLRQNSPAPSVDLPFVARPMQWCDLQPLLRAGLVLAYTGPLAADRAADLYRQWSRPCRPHQLSVSLPNDPAAQKLMTARLVDPNKGYECLGRQLAADFGAPWRERWTFLGPDLFADLAQPEGLRRLEEHFKELWRCRQLEETFLEESFDSDSGCSSSIITDTRQDSLSASLIKQFANLHLNSITIDEASPTSTSSDAACLPTTPSGAARLASTPIGAARPTSTSSDAACLPTTPSGAARLTTPIGAARLTSTPIGAARPTSTPIGAARPTSTSSDAACLPTTPSGAIRLTSTPIGAARLASTPIGAVRLTSTPGGVASALPTGVASARLSTPRSVKSSSARRAPSLSRLDTHVLVALEHASPQHVERHPRLHNWLLETRRATEGGILSPNFLSVSANISQLDGSDLFLERSLDGTAGTNDRLNSPRCWSTLGRGGQNKRTEGTPNTAAGHIQQELFKRVDEEDEEEYFSA